MSTRRPYRYLHEGDGAFLDFVDPPNSNIQQNIWLVGTNNCRTCVGLYVRISPTRCLMVHIDAKSGRRVRADEDAPQNRLVTDGEGATIKQYVETQLVVEAQKNGWTPKADQKVVVCCPMWESDGDTYAGKFVIDAINSFLGRDVYVERWGGFVVDQKTGNVVNSFRFDKNSFGEGPQPGVSDWDARRETQNVEEWVFESRLKIPGEK